jgi:hypothetical protein
MRGKRIWVEEPEGKKSLRRPRRSWDDNIKMDVTERERGGMDWTDLADNSEQ